jgi:DhnA family fructose-bisphosphate aldolase class Ia
VVFGRNVIQAERPADFLAALKDVVQGRTAPEEAAAAYRL